MNKEEVIERLEKQVAAIDEAGFVKAGGTTSREFKKWRRDSGVLVRKIFGDESYHVHEFSSISYTPSMASTANASEVFRRAFLSGLENAEATLSSMRDEVEQYWMNDVNHEYVTSPLKELERLCTRFHLVAQQLRARHANRETLSIEDEYDVQDLLHALLRLSFDDIRKEEWTPSYAGSSARTDFLLKGEKIVVEVKKTRTTLSERDIGDQLIIDIKRYQTHPDAKALVCFIYDPEVRIRNPHAIENDLSGRHGNLDVRALIAPKGL